MSEIEIEIGNEPDKPKPPSRDDLLRLRRLFALTRPYVLPLSAAFLAVVVSSLMALASPVMMRYLVDAIVPGGEPSRLRSVVIWLMAIFAAQNLASAASTYLLNATGERIVVDLRQLLFEHLQRLSLSFFDSRRTGELVSRLTNDVGTVRTLLSFDLATALSQGLTMTGAVVLIVLTDWRLAVLMLAMVPIVMVLAIVFGRHLRRLSTGVQDQLAIATTVAEESIGGIRVVKSFRREAHEIGRYRQAIDRALGMTLSRVKLQAGFGPALSFLFMTATVVVLWYGGRQVLAGELTTGQLVTFIVLTMMLAGSIGAVSGLWTRLQQALGATRRLFELLDTAPAIVDGESALVCETMVGALRFEAVSFHYERGLEPVASEAGETQSIPADSTPTGPEPPASAPEKSAVPPPRAALDSISLEVAAGEVLALVGPSGAGKTTLINLLPRFYDPTEGTVRLDGHDIRRLRLSDLRQAIGIVPQDTHLFGGTVRENLLYGRLDASDDEMFDAARAANAHDFVIDLPSGYDTVVGERGVKLSTGQRQRIAIARALLKDPRILILDEATASLDSESEHLVQEAIERLMRGRTSVVIAHRLSTILHADKIAVLEAGRLIELGRHEDLLAADGLYARLYQLQFRHALSELAEAEQERTAQARADQERRSAQESDSVE